MPSVSCDAERFRRRAIDLRRQCDRIKASNQEAIRLTRALIRRSALRLSSREPDPSSPRQTHG
jgi:hypothetical protein